MCPSYRLATLNSTSFQVSHSNTKQYNNSFFICTNTGWNHLNNDQMKAPSLEDIKHLNNDQMKAPTVLRTSNN